MENFLLHAPVLIPLLAGLGITAGFMAGLLGIGGGIILVPGLYFLFATLGYEHENLMHLAVGTSLAIIIPTGLSSAFAHARHGAVRADIVQAMAPGLIAGVVAGALIADRVTGRTLSFIFAAALIVFAALMQIPPREKEGRSGQIGFARGSAGGFVAGTLSSLMGIGGATLNVPFMTLNGVPIRNAVASSAALGPFIALPGAAGFILIGLNEAGLPPFSAGYVSLPAFTVIAPLAVLAAPVGAKAAHAVSVIALRRIFAVFIVCVALKLIWDAAHG